MFLTVHGSAGALLGALTGEPVSAFLLGVGSHAVLDSIPHGDEGLFGGYERHAYIRALLRLAFVDACTLAIVLFAMLRPDHAWPSFAIIVGIAGSVLPDVASGFAILFPNVPVLRWYYKIHAYCHDRMIPYTPPLAVGLAIQSIVLAVTVFAFFRLAAG